MIDEWEEFLAYTTTPSYTVTDKRAASFMGRFTMDMITKNIGLSRVLTILARGYLHHKADGSLLDCDPYLRTDHVRNALCAWCSIPKARHAKKTADWYYETDFRKLHDQFPELVDTEGRGWYYRHVHGIANFMLTNPTRVHKSLAEKAEKISTGFDAQWRNKVVQFQVPLFSPNTQGGWIIRFDDVIADALEQGPLRNLDITLSPELEERIVQLTPPKIPIPMVQMLAKFYLANKQEDCPWVVLPVSNFDAYFGSTAFSRMYLPKLPQELVERLPMGMGVCMYRFLM